MTTCIFKMSPVKWDQELVNYSRSQPIGRGIYHKKLSRSYLGNYTIKSGAPSQ